LIHLDERSAHKPDSTSDFHYDTNGGVSQPFNSASTFLFDRDVTEVPTRTGKSMFSSEFSVVAAMQGLKPIAGVLSSKNNRSRQFASNLMKTVAVILQLRPADDFQIARARHEALLANFIGTGLDALFVAAKQPDGDKLN